MSDSVHSAPSPTFPVCLGCNAPLRMTLVDLGLSPLANSYVRPENAADADRFFPLHARVCESCLLVQVDRVVPPEDIFSDYAYFSSYSDSWLRHCKAYAEKVINRFALNSSSMVIEIASNDGYLLKNFVEAEIPVLGIEPAKNVAKVAQKKGIPTEVAFFGSATAQRIADRGTQADLVAAKNVLAHVPDINDFVAGIAILLKPDGVFTVEFPHLLNLIHDVQFDTIYHEHFTYLSLLAAEKVFVRHGLRIFDVEQIPTHGGSLRLFACLTDASHANSDSVAKVRGLEMDVQLHTMRGYEGFDARVRKVREHLLTFVAAAKTSGKRIAGYGAAAKGNTLLNYCRLDAGDIAFVCDRNPAKQHTLLPGSRIPVRTPEDMADARPDFILILPWNLADEVVVQLAMARDWGAKFVTAIPDTRILD